MAIPQTKYVNIISAVGGQSQVSQRDLIGRLFTNNPLVPAGAVIEITGLDSVGSYFGTGSNEYKFASKYFGYTSKGGNKPQKISFALHSDEAMPARLYGSAKSTTLDVLKTIVSGSITFSIGGTEYALTGLDLSGATSLSGVADIIDTALATATSGSIADFSYDSTLYRFKLETEATGSEQVIGYATGDLAVLLGIAKGNIGCIISDGSDAEAGLVALKNILINIKTTYI